MMTNKRILVCLVFLVLFSISTTAVVDLSIDDVKCIKPAGVGFKIMNNGDEDISTNKVMIESNYLSSFGVGEDVKGVDQNYKFKINGNFSADRIGKNGEMVEFASENNIYSYPGKYKLILKYENCKKEYRKCEEISEVTCPGLNPYGCNALPIEIDSCENYDDELRLKFHNVKKGLFMDVDLYKDIKYIFYGTKEHIENDMPKDTKINELGSDYYSLSFHNGDNHIDRVKIESRICGSLDYSNCNFTGSGNATSIADYKKIVSDAGNQTSLQLEKKDYSLVYVISLFVVGVILLVIYSIRKVRI